ncbi:unnamed protein product, partial [Amoebophrya sp. A25]
GETSSRALDAETAKLRADTEARLQQKEERLRQRLAEQERELRSDFRDEKERLCSELELLREKYEVAKEGLELRDAEIDQKTRALSDLMTGIRSATALNDGLHQASHLQQQNTSSALGIARARAEAVLASCGTCSDGEAGHSSRRKLSANEECGGSSSSTALHHTTSGTPSGRRESATAGGFLAASGATRAGVATQARTMSPSPSLVMQRQRQLKEQVALL